MNPRTPPPPPPRKRRGPTTAAALTLAGIAVVGWFVSTVVLGAFGLIDMNGQSGSRDLGNDHWTATMVTLAMLLVAAIIYVSPRLRKPPVAQHVATNPPPEAPAGNSSQH